jgi:DNA-binding XRE family transcriptional regulator
MVQDILEELRKKEHMTLEEMAYVIGLSKKTLIQIEKNRSKLKWPEAVTFISVFSDTDLVKSLFGDEVLDIVQSIAIQKPARRQLKTLGGESWWNTIESKEGWRLQQHKISRHFRILDQENYRIYFTYSKSDAVQEFTKYFGDPDE